jgi:hypothetical protein
MLPALLKARCSGPALCEDRRILKELTAEVLP